MSIRAKFRVSSVTDYGANQGKRIVLNAVADNNTPENERYHRYTPSGELSIAIDNPAASDQFAPGKEFYLDFTEANN